MIRIGPVTANVDAARSPDELQAARDGNDVYCPDDSAVATMIESIREAAKAGDTRGGVVEVRAFGLPPGLGSCWRWQDKLDGRLMQAVGSGWVSSVPPGWAARFTTRSTSTRARSTRRRWVLPVDPTTPEAWRAA